MAIDTQPSAGRPPQAGMDPPADGERRGQDYLRFIADTTTAGIAHCDAERRFVFVNRAYAARFGLTPDQLVGRPVAEMLGEVAYEIIRPYVDRVLAEGKPFQYEMGIPYRFGGWRYMHCSYTPELDEHGRAIGWLAVTTDVTDRLQAEQALHDSEAMLRLAQQAAGIGIFDWDLAALVARCSPRFFEILGADPGDGTMTTGTWERFVHPEDRERILGHLGRAVEGREACCADYRIVRPDGEVRWVNYTGQVVRDGEGRPVRMIGGVLDITERKRAEEALREADRRKDEFLATLAHELRNPLAPIRNAVQILLTMGPAEPSLTWAREVIDRQAQQLTRLVDDLLDVSRISRGKIELRQERLELAAVVERALETSRPVLEAFRHQLTVTFPEEPLQVMADLTRMGQVLSNLLNNAAKYTSPGGHVHLSAGRAGGEAVLKVRDDGIGIPPEMLSRIFDLFAQVDTSLERAQGGLGIGLTIARSLVEMHGGTVVAASDGPGRGSEFTVRLPLVYEAEVPTGPPPESAELAGTGLRILVVDDNKDSAESLEMWLRLMGHDVCTAYDGPRALAAAPDFQPEAVLLDIGMPGMNGYEVARQLRELPGLERVALVATTGWGQDEDRRRSKEAGFEEHLVKPLDPAALNGLLARLARKKE